MPIDTAVKRTVTVGTTPYGVASGSTTIVLQTVQCLASLSIDFSALASGDLYRVRFRDKSGNAAGAEDHPPWIVRGPYNHRFSTGYLDASGGGWEFVVDKLAGTDRSLEMTLSKVINP